LKQVFGERYKISNTMESLKGQMCAILKELSFKRIVREINCENMNP
jgi:hypothetical protein